MQKILLIDDDYEEYELLSSAFQTLEVRADIIYIQKCEDVPGTIIQHRPDLVFIDINLPSIDGINCLKIVRADKDFETLPIIIYSTSSNRTDIEKSYAHKANLYMVKPTSWEKLLSSLERILSYDWNLKPQIPLDQFLIA